MPKQLRPVGQRILDNYAFLKRICATKSTRKRHNLLIGASTDQLLSLVEICSNIIKGKFALTPRQRAKLIPFAPVVRKLARARSEKSARRTAVQTGGSAGLFVSLLAPVLVDAARHLIQKVAAADGQ